MLLAYLFAMLAIGLAMHRRTKNSGDYYLGGSTLGPWVAALAANASSSSAWSLLGVSGFAFQSGMAALWLLPGCIGGFLINWLLVAPGIRRITGQAVTLTELLAGPRGRPWRSLFVWFASLLTLFSLMTYVAAQLQAAGSAFQHPFSTPADPFPLWQGILCGAALVVLYTSIGGYLAASMTDMVQGLLMAGVAILLPVLGLIETGGLGQLLNDVQAISPEYGSMTNGREGLWLSAGFALGFLGIGLGYPGQPHAINKYMGMSPGASMQTARIVGIAWAVVLYVGMILVGWIARTRWAATTPDQEMALFTASQNLLPPLLDGVVIAAILAATMSTVDGQMLVCASSASHDLRLGQQDGDGPLRTARWTMLAVGIAATVAALLVDKDIFNHVLFAWAALGSAFGPLVLVSVLRGPVSAGWALASSVSGAALAIYGFYQPIDGAKGVVDRVASWLVALLFAWLGSRRRPS